MEKEVIFFGKERIPGDERVQCDSQDPSHKDCSKRRWKVFFILSSLACDDGPSVTTSSTDFSFQNLGFWNLFEFSAAEITLKLLSPTI
jgi:hypothetical protein